jgi:hypothetical protein
MNSNRRQDQIVAGMSYMGTRISQPNDLASNSVKFSNAPSSHGNAIQARWIHLLIPPRLCRLLMCPCRLISQTGACIWHASMTSFLPPSHTMTPQPPERSRSSRNTQEAINHTDCAWHGHRFRYTWGGSNQMLDSKNGVSTGSMGDCCSCPCGVPHTSVSIHISSALCSFLIYTHKAWCQPVRLGGS